MVKKYSIQKSIITPQLLHAPLRRDGVPGPQAPPPRLLRRRGPQRVEAGVPLPRFTPRREGPSLQIRLQRGPRGAGQELRGQEGVLQALRGLSEADVRAGREGGGVL